MADEQGQFKCDDCKDLGWIFARNSEAGRMEIQRCDACEKYGSDNEAWELLKQAIEWSAHETKARGLASTYVHLDGLLREVIACLKPHLTKGTLDSQSQTDFKEVEGRLFYTDRMYGRYEGETRELYVRDCEPMILVRVVSLLDAKHMHHWTDPRWGVEVIEDPTGRSEKFTEKWVDGTSRHKNGQVKEHQLTPLVAQTRAAERREPET